MLVCDCFTRSVDSRTDPILPAHLMTPFGGQGVNIAMADAMMLAENIVRMPHDLDKAVKNYESWMFSTAEGVTSKTWKNLLDRFEEGGSAKFVQYIEGERRKVEEKQVTERSVQERKVMEQVKEESKMN